MRLSSAYILQTLLVGSVSARLLSFSNLFGANKQTPLTTDPVGPAMAPSDEPPSQGGVLLSDVMGRDRSFNVFAGFARDVEAVARRLDSPSENSTVLAPLNSAIDELPGKPWEDPRDYSALGASVYEGDEGRERARRNIRRFVEAHVVPVSPWREKDKVRSLLDGDREIWWEKSDDGMVLQPDGIEIQNVVSKVGNGEVWVIKAVRGYT